MRAQMAQRVPVLALGGNEFGCRRSDEHLPAVTERQKPCHAVERRAEIVALPLLGGSDMHRHANGEPSTADQSWRASACWALIAAPIASDGRRKAALNASPPVLNTSPPCVAIALRTMSSCARSASCIAAR